MSLVEKIRKARETKVEAGGFAFVIRRPTALEMAEMPAISRGRAILPFVIGWEGVKEIDVIPGGDPHPLAFDAGVCSEWLGDRLDILAPLATQIFDAYTAHQKAIEEQKKS
jgi:hypothetical protein